MIAACYRQHNPNNAQPSWYIVATWVIRALHTYQLDINFDC